MDKEKVRAFAPIEMDSPRSTWWEEVFPGRFERPLDTIERFFVAIGAGGAPLGKEHWSISIVARIRPSPALDDMEQALAHAWKTMRYRFPQIACTVQAGTTKIYEVPDAAALEAWLSGTFFVERGSRTTGDLLATFTPGPLATLHYLPSSSEILIHMSHWRIDGVGSLLLLDHFLSALVCPQHPLPFGSEPATLSPSLEAAARIPQTPPTAELMAQAHTLSDEYVRNLPSIGLLTLPNQLPGATRRISSRLSLEASAALLAGCRARGLGITAVGHASLVIATYQSIVSSSSSPLTTTKYTAFTPVNMRPYLEAPYGSSAHAVQLYVAGLPISVDAAAGFETIASRLQALYTQKLGRPDSNFLEFLPAYLNKNLESLAAPPSVDTPPPSQPDFNSLGKLDAVIKYRYGVAALEKQQQQQQQEEEEEEEDEVGKKGQERSRSLEVEDVWLGVEMLTRQLEFYQWSWKGQLVFSICWNEAFYMTEHVQNFLDTFKKVLAENLTVFE